MKSMPLRVRTRPSKSKKHSVQAIVATLFALLVIAASAYTFLVLKHDPTLTDLRGRLHGASASHPLGTDHLGRDVLTRLLLGGGQTIG